MANYLKDGERIRADANGRQFHVKADGSEEIVRDGQRVSVPMIMMDSARRASPAADPAAVHKPKVDVATVNMSDHRPGYVGARLMPGPSAAVDAGNAAFSFADMVRRKTDAWKYTK